MKLKVLLLSIFSIGFMATQVHAKPADDLMTKLKTIETFKGDFKQEIIDSHGKELQKSEGMLYIKRPGRFNWKSESPDELLVVADGNIIWTYDIDLEQIIKQDQESSLGQSPAGLLAGEVVDLDKEYDIVILSSNQCHQNVDTCFKLVPKDNEGQFRIIKIGFSGNELVMIYMKDALDQSISTDFTNVKMNIPLDSSLFDFTPPPGVDVLKGSE